MSHVPVRFRNLTPDMQVVSLLHLGWTHEEIAEAAGVSKGTVQRVKDRVKRGSLAAPPSLFPLLRARERSIHQANKGSDLPLDERSEHLADRLELINQMAMFDVGPDGEISYDDLSAFAELISKQLTNDRDNVEIIKRLAEWVDLSNQVDRDPISLAKEIDDLVGRQKDGDQDFERSWSNLNELKDRHEPLENADDRGRTEGSPGFQRGPFSTHGQIKTAEMRPTVDDTEGVSPVLDCSLSREECLALGGQWDRYNCCRIPNENKETQP